MRRYMLLVVAALTVLPASALAAKPPHPAHPAHPATLATTSTIPTTTTTMSHPAKPPKVLYVLRGTLSNYTAANGSTNGSVSVLVKSSNFESKSFKGTTLTFAVTSSTNVVLHNGNAITNGDRGVVKVRAAKKSSATALQTSSAFEVIDQGASSTAQLIALQT